jgi:glycogen debranching enzyme
MHIECASVPAEPASAFRIAVGDIAGNILVQNLGILEEHRPVLLAGLDYGRPWTRDASINAWNGVSLLRPDLARDTLLSVLVRDSDGLQVGGQYWDAIIWCTAAWHHFLCTGDRWFLATALDATIGSLLRFEQTELDADWGLFRGAACYGDGVAAYPDRYARAGGGSGILSWPENNPDERHPNGFGVPMMALSTNLLYLNAYRVAGLMAGALGVPPEPSWSERERRLAEAIHRHFWMEDRGHYRYFVDPWGGCDHQEGLGNALAVVFRQGDSKRRNKVLDTVHMTPHGLPCVWPTFQRYARQGGYGRHSGTVWPHIQGFWAHAAALEGRRDILTAELTALQRNILRDAHCAEIYHPDTGLPYGGLQERDGRIAEWQSCRRQTWSATAYLRMLLMGVLGMRVSAVGLRFAPCLPPGLVTLEIRGIRYRRGILGVRLRRGEGSETTCTVDGTPGEPLVPAELTGEHHVELSVPETAG